MSTAVQRGADKRAVALSMAGNLAGELVGTFFLVLAIITVATQGSAALKAAGAPEGLVGFVTVLAVGLTAALVLAALAAASGHTSGGHFNPAVTLGLAVGGKFPLRQAGPYMAAQLAGSLAAAFALQWFGPKAVVAVAGELGAPAPGNPALLWFGVFAAEVLGTFLLMYVIMCTAADDRAASAAAPFAIGGALGVGIIITGFTGGGSLNPARALGPMLMSWSFTYWWIYLTAPFLGAALAAVLHRFVLSKASPPEPKAKS